MEATAGPESSSPVSSRGGGSLARGFRDAERQFAKPEGVRRVLCVGDSFTWGWGVEDDKIYTRVLQRMLDAEGRRTEVINAGIKGYGTVQCLVYLLHEGFEYAPDVVVDYPFRLFAAAVSRMHAECAARGVRLIVLIDFNVTPERMGHWRLRCAHIDTRFVRPYLGRAVAAHGVPAYIPNDNH